MEISILLESDVFFIEGALVTLVRDVGDSGEEPSAQFGTCVENKISGLRAEGSASYSLWLGDVHVRHVADGRRWFVSRTIHPLHFECAKPRIPPGLKRLPLPYEQIFELTTLDCSQQAVANQPITWLSAPITHTSRTDETGKMRLMENPSVWMIDLPQGIIVQMQRIV